MSSQPIHYENREDVLSDVQGELLEALLQPQEDFYPWNPAEPEAEEYFAERERGFSLSDWQQKEEIENAFYVLFDQLHQCWASRERLPTDTLKMSLSQQFARVPQAWVEAIASTARQVLASNLSLADQLVYCVKPLLANWTEEDLLVLARPWAYAMRGNPETAEEGNLSTVRSVEWMELSQMEQVRLTLAVAHSALVQLQNSTSNL